ncbi:MAG TPA: HlyD family efflux transporter periplasmic adaptor subunit [Rhodopila sp.]|nr:HlyD family efflux transporter periplasmic adaptor subunit [Rhodopila sp.]
MRRLKARLPAETPANEVRSHRLAIIRWVYLTTIAGLGVWVLNLLFGGLIYLRSEGMVLGEPAVVAAEFPATVRDLAVREGDRVEAGQVVSLVSSQTVSTNLARFAGDQADRSLRISELRMRSLTVDRVIGLAKQRQEITIDARARLESLQAMGYLPIEKRTAAMDSVFRSSQAVAELEGQQDSLRGEITTLSGAFDQADRMVQELRQQYDGGRLRASIKGIVGSLLTEKGAVLGAGQPLMELYGDDRFVLAYVPTGGLFSIRPNQKVRISTGLQTFDGTIVRVEPIAAALPHEFQRAFTPVDRRQVIRVEFAPGQQPPPLFTKVTLSNLTLLPGWLRAWLPGRS